MATEGDPSRHGNAVKEGGTANAEVGPPSIALPRAAVRSVVSARNSPLTR